MEEKKASHCCQTEKTCGVKLLSRPPNPPLPIFRYQEILHSIHLTRKAKLGLRTCDGYSELLKYLRSDITEVASRLQKGGLGYLDDNMDVEDEVTALSGNINVRLLKLCGETDVAGDF